MQLSTTREATGCATLENLPTFYGTWRFITEFTRVHQLSLSWVGSIQSVPPNPISPRSILILSIHLWLCLPSGHFPSDFPTNNLYAFLVFPFHATLPAHLVPIDLTILIILGKGTNHEAPCYAVFSTSLSLNPSWSKYPPQHLLKLIHLWISVK
jgi:hypothetical protein